MMWVFRILFVALLAIDALILNAVAFEVVQASRGRVEEGGIVPVVVQPSEEYKSILSMILLLVLSNVAIILTIVVGLVLVAPEKIIVAPKKNLTAEGQKVGGD